MIPKAYLRMFDELEKERYTTWKLAEFLDSKKMPTDKVNVVLRIDVDRNLEYVPYLAEELKKRGINAVFNFLTFEERYYNIWNSKIPKMVADLGFEIGLHTDHYYEQLLTGKDAITAIKKDARKLSDIAGKEVLGMAYHGHKGINDLGKNNANIYLGIDPEKLGLKYHDGYTSNYLKSGAKTWYPNTDYSMSDFFGITAAMTYFPNFASNFLKKIPRGKSVHVSMHVNIPLVCCSQSDGEGGCE